MKNHVRDHLINQAELRHYSEKIVMNMENETYFHFHNQKSDKGEYIIYLNNLRQKFWISLSIAIPVFLLSFIEIRFPIHLPFSCSEWAVFLLVTFLFFYGGKPFFAGATTELKEKKPAMMTLTTIAISLIYLYSLFAFVSNNILYGQDHKAAFFWELATLMVILLLVHYVEIDVIGNATNTSQKMTKLLPECAHLLQENGEVKDVPLREIKINRDIRVKKGEKIPADGIVISGETTVDESMITGEIKKIKKQKDSKVIGGSVNNGNTIIVKVTGTGETGYLAQVMKIVSRIQKEKSPAEIAANKAATIVFYITLSVGIIAFAIWVMVTKDFSLALERMVTVFIIACPHVLVLSIPLVIIRSTSLAAKQGLIINNRKALEKAKKVSVAILDLTEMLTEENHVKPEAIDFISGLKQQNILPVILTENNDTTVQNITRQLNIENIHAISSQKDKTDIIRQYQQKDKVVMMIKNSKNGSLSLNKADIDIVIDTGTNISTNQSDIILIKKNLLDILYFLSLAKHTSNKMVQNLRWSIGYNIIAISLAGGILAPGGILISPFIGAILVAMSTIVITVNTFLLK